jgi:hypothetical protein
MILLSVVDKLLKHLVIISWLLRYYSCSNKKHLLLQRPLVAVLVDQLIQNSFTLTQISLLEAAKIASGELSLNRCKFLKV